MSAISLEGLRIRLPGNIITPIPPESLDLSPELRVLMLDPWENSALQPASSASLDLRLSFSQLPKAPKSPDVFPTTSESCNANVSSGPQPSTLNLGFRVLGF